LYTDNDLINAATSDGLTFTGSTNMPALLGGNYIVALITTTADQVNYHWLRREPDGTWSHKPGDGQPQKSDATETAIDNGNPPHQANFNYPAIYTGKLAPLLAMAQQQGWAINDDHFVGYFYCPDLGLQPVQEHKKKGGCTLL
jgi:hypothetical protein